MTTANDTKISIRLPQALDLALRREILRAREDRRVLSLNGIIIAALERWLERREGK